MLTLDEVIAQGRGIERPFRCPVHEDHHASASVNVVKGVWCCYACHAKGTIDGKHAPSPGDLLAMLEPEKAGRVYPERYLELFHAPDNYWESRFSPWVCWLHSLGEDPFSGEPTYPVRTPEGRLAGVCRRKINDNEEGPKYRYPRNWAASRTLGGWPVDKHFNREVVVIGEGMADALAVRECGVLGLAAYGSMLHAPQRELLARINPKLILLGFDNDEAGQRGAELSRQWIEDLAPVGVILWAANDPADDDVFARKLDIVETVRAMGYGPHQVEQWSQQWHETTNHYAEAYRRSLEN